MPHQHSEEWKYAMFLVSYPDTIPASITVAWYWFSCLVLQPTGLLLPYLPFSSPLYTLLLLTDSITFYFVLVLTDLYPFLWLLKIISNSKWSCSAECLQQVPARHGIQMENKSCSKPLLSVLFRVLPVFYHTLFYSHGLCLTWQYYAFSKIKNWEIKILKCWSTSIWFSILNHMYFITLCFRGTWNSIVIVAIIYTI